MRSNWVQGVKRFFITDDNFARNKDWEAIYDRIIKLREEDGMDVRFMIQVDTLCHKIPNFIEKSRRAGVTRVFIGLENINPANLIAAKKRQNKITEYRKMLLEWKRGRHHDLRRLHPRLPQRHAGIDPPRSGDHQARAAARRAGVLRADAAARLGGSQGPLREGCVDGPRPQQIRARARRLRPRQDDARKSGRAPTAPPGTFSTRTSIWRRSCGAPPPPASTSARSCRC